MSDQRNDLRIESIWNESILCLGGREHENRGFASDIPEINIQPVKDKPDDSPRSNDETDRIHRRRQRRQNLGNEISTQTPTIPHTPVRAAVIERPDPSSLNLRWNPYEAGDRAYEISRLKPVTLVPKQIEIQSNSSSIRSSRNVNFHPMLDDLALPDRAATATDAFATRKRPAKTILETDQQATMRTETNRRAHHFHDDAVYVNSISKNSRPKDYRDEYLMAKQSVVNTKNILSAIRGDLETIADPNSGDNYRA